MANPAKIKDQMKHWNGHLPVSIDTETTGTRPGFHDVWQVAVVPLNADYEIDKSYQPFDMLIIPRRPDNWDPKAVKKEKLMEVLAHGMDPDLACDLFMAWIEKLKLPTGKRLIPYGFNWPFDKPFLQDWIGFKAVDEFFDAHYRDLFPITAFLNDLAGYQTLQVQYPRYSLGSMCNRLGVANVNPHDALCDAVAQAECYRRLIKENLLFMPTARPLSDSEIKEDDLLREQLNSLKAQLYELKQMTGVTEEQLAEYRAKLIATMMEGTKDHVPTIHELATGAGHTDQVSGLGLSGDDRT